MTKFSLSDVDKWVAKSDARMEALFHESAQELTRNIMKPRAKGGRFPVDTSFLRNSVAAAVNTLPTGPTQKPDGYTNKEPDFSALALAINRATLGDRITIGFTANYASYMESKYGMVRSETVNWKQIVNKSLAKVKGQIK